MWINKTQNASYNFVPPSIESDADSKVEVIFPTVEKQTVTAGAAVELSIVRACTIVAFAAALAADMTLTADIASDVPVGAMLHITALSDATARDITFSTGFSAPALAGVISKTKVQSFIYNGTAFVPMGASLQID